MNNFSFKVIRGPFMANLRLKRDKCQVCTHIFCYIAHLVLHEDVREQLEVVVLQHKDALARKRGVEK